MHKPLRPNNLSDPLNPVKYRPTYRPKVGGENYVLENTTQTRPKELSNFLNPIEALEAWCKEESSKQDDKWVRWHPDYLQTLRVFIQAAPGSVELALLKKACHAWEAASGGLIRFMTTLNPKHADIRLLWASEPVPGRPYETGHTDRLLHPPCWIKQVTITLMAAPVIDTHLSRQQGSNRLYATMLHELGHALGLEHSTAQKDVMHHQGWQNTLLSENDIHQLQALYLKPIPTQFLV